MLPSLLVLSLRARLVQCEIVHEALGMTLVDFAAESTLIGTATAPVAPDPIWMRCRRSFALPQGFHVPFLLLGYLWRFKEATRPVV